MDRLRTAIGMLALALLLVAPGPARAGGIQQELESRLAEAVRERAGISPAADIRVRDVRPSNKRALRDAARLVAVELPPGERGAGKVTASVTVADKKGKEEDLWVTARVEVAVPVVVATRDIARGASIMARDVRVEPRSDLRGEAFGDPGEVVGREARRAIREGEILDSRVVTLPISIKRGDLVDAVIMGAAFQVRSRAEAKESGAVGDVIRVQLIGGSRKVLRGRVVSSETIEVTE